MLLSLNGFYENKGYIFIGDSLYINVVLYLLSRLFKLCSWHRILIITQTVCLGLEFLSLINVQFDVAYWICGVIILGSLLALIYGKICKKKTGKSNERFN